MHSIHTEHHTIKLIQRSDLDGWDIYVWGHLGYLAETWDGYGSRKAAPLITAWTLEDLTVFDLLRGFEIVDKESRLWTYATPGGIGFSFTHGHSALVMHPFGELRPVKCREDVRPFLEIPDKIVNQHIRLAPRNRSIGVWR